MSQSTSFWSHTICKCLHLRRSSIRYPKTLKLLHLGCKPAFPCPDFFMHQLATLGLEGQHVVIAVAAAANRSRVSTFSAKFCVDSARLSSRTAPRRMFAKRKSYGIDFPALRQRSVAEQLLRTPRRVWAAFPGVGNVGLVSGRTAQSAVAFSPGPPLLKGAGRCDQSLHALLRQMPIF